MSFPRPRSLNVMCNNLPETLDPHQKRERTRVIRPLILALALLGAVLLLGPGTVRADAPSITVLPSSANQFQTVTVKGAGFAPRTPLWVTFVSPVDEEIVYWSGSGRASVTTDADGRFSVSIVPAVDFAGAQAGLWRVAVCVADTGECWERTFTVRS